MICVSFDRSSFGVCKNECQLLVLCFLFTRNISSCLRSLGGCYNNTRSLFGLFFSLDVGDRMRRRWQRRSRKCASVPCQSTHVGYLYSTADYERAPCYKFMKEKPMMVCHRLGLKRISRVGNWQTSDYFRTTLDSHPNYIRFQKNELRGGPFVTPERSSWWRIPQTLWNGEAINITNL